MTDCLSENHDDALMNLLVENKTLVNFLFSIFGFLRRKTDFYMVRENNEGVGFPPGVAEELVVQILRKCNPYESYHQDLNFKTEPNYDHVPNVVAEEVEVETSEFHDNEESEDIPNTVSQQSDQILSMENLSLEGSETNHSSSENVHINNPCEAKYEPEPMRSEEIDKFNTAESQKDSETYNGAKRDKYSWSQKIGELDITVPLSPLIKSAKLIRVNISSSVFCIECYLENEWKTLINENLSFKIKTGETVWIMSEGKLRIHLEKSEERWWTSLLESEPEIDTQKIDCSRPLDELPEEHIAKVRELQWNQMQKLAGKPTSEEIKKQETLRKAWNADGSPFKNMPFDPSIFTLTNK